MNAASKATDAPLSKNPGNTLIFIAFNPDVLADPCPCLRRFLPIGRSLEATKLPGGWDGAAFAPVMGKAECIQTQAYENQSVR
jgi:hypothetical protein